MEYTWMQIAWIFFIYSFVGWLGEVFMAVINRRKFVNRGFVNGPLCPIYGFGAVLFSLFLPELKSNLFFLFLGGTVLATVLEYVTGLLMEKIFNKKLWNYSNIRFNLDGYVCVRYSLFWGLLSVLLILFLNPLLCKLVSFVPYIIALAALWGLAVLLFLDFLGTALAVLGLQSQAARFAQLTEGMQHTSKMLENALTEKIQSRMLRSFPSIDMGTLVKYKEEKAQAKEQPKIFAAGCSFYKLVCLFLIGAFLGDIIETIFCVFAMGRLMSRSSVVYGPFSIVWGLACGLLTGLLYRYKDKSSPYIFMAGTILGGAYEYICSVFTELMFGTIFWDYSGFTFNLGGRINLLYCLFWGVAAIIWLKAVYPFLSRLIEKIPVKAGTIVCNILIVFMIFNMLISSLALARYTERNTISAVTAEETSEIAQAVNAFLDARFTDERMERIYPNAKIVENMEQNKNSADENSLP